MKKIEFNEIVDLSLEEYDKYCVNILQNVKREKSGVFENIEAYNILHNKWEKCRNVHFNFVSNYYRIIPEKKKQIMTLEEFVNFCEMSTHIWIMGFHGDRLGKFEYGFIDRINQTWCNIPIEHLCYINSLKDTELKKFEIEEN